VQTTENNRIRKVYFQKSWLWLSKSKYESSHETNDRRRN